MHNSSESDDLAGLFVQTGLHPDSYQVFQPDTSASRSFPLGLHEAVKEPAVRQVQKAPNPSLKPSIPRGLDPPDTVLPLAQLAEYSRWDRWSGLDAALSASAPRHETAQSPSSVSHPQGTLLAGICAGVGTTSLAASLARIAAHRGEHVYLFDSSETGLLSLFFGVDQLSQTPTTVVLQGGSGRTSIQISCHNLNGLQEAVAKWTARSMHLLHSKTESLFIDGGVVLPSTGLEDFGDIAHVLVLVPDMRCLAALSYYEEQQRKSDPPDRKSVPLLLLNQFEPEVRFHLEIRDRLTARYGDRLIPVCIRRDTQIGMALAEGTTVLDYAPESPAVHDLNRLADWISEHSREQASYFSREETRTL